MFSRISSTNSIRRPVIKPRGTIHTLNGGKHKQQQQQKQQPSEEATPSSVLNLLLAAAAAAAGAAASEQASRTSAYSSPSNVAGAVVASGALSNRVGSYSMLSQKRKEYMQRTSEFQKASASPKATEIRLNHTSPAQTAIRDGIGAAAQQNDYRLTINSDSASAAAATTPAASGNTSNSKYHQATVTKQEPSKQQSIFRMAKTSIKANSKHGASNEPIYSNNSELLMAELREAMSTGPLANKIAAAAAAVAAGAASSEERTTNDLRINRGALNVFLLIFRYF
jgi:hypothetical protein